MEAKATGSEKGHLPNRLGVKGWVWAGHYTVERYLYTLHRLTGLGLLLYVILHLIMNGFRLGGEETWTNTIDFLTNPFGSVVEYLVMVAFTFHALNGGRLILQHLGYTLGSPKPPVYPYVDSMRRRRPIVWVMGVVIVGLAIYFLVEFVA